jgi:hypothetical protein
MKEAYVSSSFIIVCFAILLLAYSCFTNGRVGSIRVAGLCGIKLPICVTRITNVFANIGRIMFWRAGGGKWWVFIWRWFTCLNQCYHPRFRPQFSNYNLFSSHFLFKKLQDLQRTQCNIYDTLKLWGERNVKYMIMDAFKVLSKNSCN